MFLIAEDDVRPFLASFVNQNHMLHNSEPVNPLFVHEGLSWSLDVETEARPRCGHFSLGLQQLNQLNSEMNHF